jgi:Type III secretion needle MxiH, YscF, SsaG, EprI, PscF, EscF
MTTIGVSSTASSGTGFDLDSVSSTLGRSLQSTESDLDSFMQTMDPNNMDDILQLQMYMIQWETTVQTTSSVYKGIGDTLKGVANNVGS